ncbi:methyltransferase domain-containing protein [candidate division WOR-3 bacterium]|nr:methyltransferase domain-containing protein [candidate division WOR-3 bacterium]
MDRYYIENFLNKNKSHIKGHVLEVAENTYTLKFGDSEVEKSDILHLTQDNPNATIVGDITKKNILPENTFDCFIMTQTLLVVYDIKSAIKNSIKALKTGGVLLVTVPGISQISRYDMDRWGDYWRFTDLSLRRLFEEVVPPENIEIEVYGNVLSAVAFLYGLAQHELTKKELDYEDKDYQVIIAAVIRKPKS